MRADGRKIKTIDPMSKIALHIMNQRIDAANYIELFIPEEPIKKYISEKRKQGHKITHLGVVLAAFTRTVSQYPFLNRFVVNEKIYARKEITVGMVVLKPGTTDETMNKMYFEPTDTVFEVQDKVSKYIDENRQSGDNNATDKIITTLMKIPGLSRIAVHFLMWLDKHNLLPKGVIDASPFHCSLVITNLASIRTSHVLHHIYNFGTTSLFFAMGNMKDVPKKVKGELTFEKCIPFGLTMDERIGNGAMFAFAFETLQKYLKNPELLEERPETVVEDIP